MTSQIHFHLLVVENLFGKIADAPPSDIQLCCVNDDLALRDQYSISEVAIPNSNVAVAGILWNGRVHVERGHAIRVPHNRGGLHSHSHVLQSHHSDVEQQTTNVQNPTIQFEASREKSATCSISGTGFRKLAGRA